MQIETTASTNPSPSDRDGPEDEDITLFIALGILIPLSFMALIYLCYTCFKNRGKSLKAIYSEKSQQQQQQYHGYPPNNDKNNLPQYLSPQNSAAG